MIGDNHPPDMTVTAAETTAALSAFMSQCPVIEAEDKAREAKVYIDRATLCIADLEAERGGRVKPLNEQVKSINDYYRQPKELLGRVLFELEQRIAVYIRKEEAHRRQIAEEARRHAEEAERLAREAERAEKDAASSAELGELDLDIATHIQAADQAFENFEKAQHEASLAERETKVKIGGGFRRALALKTQEIIVVVDVIMAINAIGVTDDIEAAVIKGARAYKRLHGSWPSGILIETERKV